MGAESDTSHLKAALARLEACLVWSDDRLAAVAPAVSGWSSAQQVEHVLIALRRMLAAIRDLRAGSSAEIKSKGRPTLVGRGVLMGGWIPRGKAEAPDFSVPMDMPTPDALRDSLAAAQARFAEIAPDAGTLKQVEGVIDHPMLGGFSASQWWRFARVHTEHHLAIIDDIAQALDETEQV